MRVSNENDSNPLKRVLEQCYDPNPLHRRGKLNLEKFFQYFRNGGTSEWGTFADQQDNTFLDPTQSRVFVGAMEGPTIDVYVIEHPRSPHENTPSDYVVFSDEGAYHVQYTTLDGLPKKEELVENAIIVVYQPDLDQHNLPGILSAQLGRKAPGTPVVRVSKTDVLYDGKLNSSPLLENAALEYARRPVTERAA